MSQLYKFTKQRCTERIQHRRLENVNMNESSPDAEDIRVEGTHSTGAH